MKKCLLILSLFLVACSSEPKKNGFAPSDTQNNAQNNANNGSNNGPNNENNLEPACGDGELDPGELCDSAIVEGDGSCPSACPAPACSTATLIGDACTVQCLVEPVGCIDDDGCCSVGCDRLTDNDCDNICGDGVVEGSETCDGNCPTTCPDQNACATSALAGSADTCSAQCESTAITTCIDTDGCCAPGCNANTDSDCDAVCGNDTLEPGETCDGDCPSCSDNNACTIDSRVGSTATCDVVCSNTPISQCIDGDGCCPNGCNRSNDDDCAPSCGDGIVDFPAETCDGNCPVSCNDQQACTNDVLSGSGGDCTAACDYFPISQCISNDGCCPTGCTSQNDNDCVACTPTTCAAENVECGFISDGCAGVLNCGGCNANGSCVVGRCQYPGSTGSSCVQSVQCTADPNAYCIASNAGYPGGYCSMSCIIGLCNDFSVCVDSGFLFGECHSRCESSQDCRPGYGCYQVTNVLLGITENACLPN